eukprot:TRINITY_DN24456_c0_g1_i1.p1 TRINITY_DN24456_c0_g1~~TRINITY_DN24456_c0_g1_i1.p1  ORF type:complete len:522 (-),score=69.22 TRINITY_DN24456_c0_g1_i1:14-1486(-)
MLDKACVPVIVQLKGVSNAKIPFPALLPWHKFAIFWDLGKLRRHSEEGKPDEVSPVGSAHQLLRQLQIIDPKVLERKRKALLRYAPSLRWEDGISCGAHQKKTALDLLAAELAIRLTRYAQTQSTLIPWMDWAWKIPDDHLAMSEVEDLTGTGCPLAFPHCEVHPTGSHVCTAAWPGRPYNCPLGCKQYANPPLCRRVPEGTPCDLPDAAAIHRGILPCGQMPFRHPDDDLPHHQGIIRRPRIALITWSDRPELAKLTLPSLERFCEEHPGRYELIVEQEPLLDPRQWAPAWNKLAFLRRHLITGFYDAVLWIDDDILITEPTLDPIFEGLKDSLVKLWNDTYIYASKDVREDDRVRFNTGILGLRRGRRAMRLIQDLFKIANRPEVLDDQVFVTRREGWWDQDAFAVWAQDNDLELAYLEEHRKVQSFVRDMDNMEWQPGDFAAHFTGFRNQEQRLALVRQFMRERRLRNRGLIGMSDQKQKECVLSVS